MIETCFYSFSSNHHSTPHDYDYDDYPHDYDEDNHDYHDYHDYYNGGEDHGDDGGKWI